MYTDEDLYRYYGGLEEDIWSDGDFDTYDYIIDNNDGENDIYLQTWKQIWKLYLWTIHETFLSTDYVSRHHWWERAELENTDTASSIA